MFGEKLHLNFSSIILPKHGAHCSIILLLEILRSAGFEEITKI
jgi:hypothetical protein